MTDDFVRHFPHGGLPSGRDGMKAAGEPVTGMNNEVGVTVTMTVAEGYLVADRVEAATGIGSLRRRGGRRRRRCRGALCG
jgi:hypothetical protein